MKYKTVTFNTCCIFENFYGDITEKLHLEKNVERNLRYILTGIKDTKDNVFLRLLEEFYCIAGNIQKQVLSSICMHNDYIISNCNNRLISIYSS